MTTLNNLIDRSRQLAPGIFIAIITGLAALFLSEHYGAPAMLFALLLGIAMSFLYQDTQCRSGIEFTACHVLRIGVALLGLRIAFDDVVALGWQTALLLVCAVGSTIVFGITLAKVFQLNKRFGALTGGSVAICGASAAMAISAVLPNDKNRERDTLLTVIGVTSLSTIAMVAYPIIASYLGLDETQTSIFLGGTIHDVAQVVGAGYSVSEQTGDLATLTKLVRVAFLMPVVLCFLIVLKANKNIVADGGKAPGLPGFLVAFIILMVLNSVMNVPELVTTSATEVSRFALVVSIAAIGMKSNLGQLTKVGFKPILLMVAETAWIALIILAWLLYF
ncbi:YeiH family protein [Planctobacterium marinum]|uniref:Phosphoenolpyruvate carboxylase n=1 Tax=Planctobacterium marinum TaxID=1631968 RepID=A0AA48KWB0_9ALTE|nr:phosphoenolpyruvate carboxylase [Planctobacterium marinum]